MKIQGDISQDQNTTAISFEAMQKGIVFKRPKWKVNIFCEFVEFISVDGKENISITKEEGKKRIEFASAFVSEYNIKFNHDNKEYKFSLASKDLIKLRSWIIPKTDSEIASDIKRALIICGGTLILVGIFHFIFSDELSPLWGGVLLIVGVVSLFVSSRYLFLANGIILILASVMNGYTLIESSSQDINMPGSVVIFQLIWGLEEFVRFREYGLNQERLRNKGN